MEQSIFIKEYINLVGRHSKLNVNRLWWATHFSSKNRFMSHVLECLLNDRKGIRKPQVPIGWSIYSFFFQWIRFIKQGVSLSFRWVIVRKKLGVNWKKDLSVEDSYYVIKSFVYDRSFKKEGFEDPFFDPIVSYLSSRRKVLILVNILGNLKFCLDKIQEERKCHIIPLELYVSLFDIWRECWQACFYKIKTENPCMFEGEDVSKIIQDEIKRSLKEVHPYQSLHYQATKNFAQRYSISEFLLTYENNPWERMSIMALREVSPSAKIIGYQHAVVPQSALNMFVSEEDVRQLPMPDKVLTVGLEPKLVMEEYGYFPKGIVQPSCGLRFEYLFDLPQYERQKKKIVLLALEGILEVYHMINYVVDQLKNTEYHILVRSHPVLPFEQWKKKLNFDPRKISNFENSSTTSLKEDIKKAGVVIYWGTTVALESLWMGRPVMHYDMNLGLNYDPLFRCNHLKFNMNRKRPLSDQLDEIFQLDQREFVQKKELARQYLKQYFTPVNLENLAIFAE